MESKKTIESMASDSQLQLPEMKQEAEYRKFSEEHNNHPGRWLAKSLLVPGYMLRNRLCLQPYLDEKDKGSKFLTPGFIGLDIARAVTYAYLASRVIESFIR